MALHDDGLMAVGVAYVEEYCMIQEVKFGATRYPECLTYIHDSLLGMSQ